MSGQPSRYGDQTTGHVSEICVFRFPTVTRGLSPKPPYEIWASSSLIFRWHGGLCPEIKRPGRETHLEPFQNCVLRYRHLIFWSCVGTLGEILKLTFLMFTLRSESFESIPYQCFPFQQPFSSLDIDLFFKYRSPCTKFQTFRFFWIFMVFSLQKMLYPIQTRDHERAFRH